MSNELRSLAQELGWDLPMNDMWEDSTAEEEGREIIQKAPEDIDVVVEATTYTSEDVHGGDEATGDIEGSPNPSINGVDNSGQLSGGASKPAHPPEGGSREKADNDASMRNFMEKIVRLPLDDELPQACREVARREKGRLETDATTKWDVKKLNKLLLRGEDWEIQSAKKKDSPAREMACFIDLSGSFEKFAPVIKACLKILGKEGFKVSMYDCANGFGSDKYGSIHAHDCRDNYHTYERLCRLCGNTKARVKNECISPCIGDAVKICEKVDFSIIFADYDGFSTFSEVSYKCREDKIPYLFDFETRYDNPEEHDWNYAPYYDYKDHSRWWSFRNYAEEMEERLYGNGREEDDE